MNGTGLAGSPAPWPTAPSGPLRCIKHGRLGPGDNRIAVARLANGRFFMSAEFELFASLALLGIGTGFLAGLIGIGGGMLLVPFLTLILSGRGIPADLSVKMAIATSMATIVFTSISSVRAHHKRGAVRWDIVRSMAPGTVIGGMLASLGVFAILKGTLLALIFAAFVTFSASQMILDKKPPASRQMPGAVGQLGSGGFIGFLSGLVGAGGGFISVPFLTWCNVSIHNAVATSAALGFPIALANVAGYVLTGQKASGLPAGALGYIWTPALAVVAAGSVLTAPLGARVAHASPVRRLKQVFSGVLFVLAGYMLYKGLH